MGSFILSDYWLKTLVRQEKKNRGFFGAFSVGRFSLGGVRYAMLPEGLAISDVVPMELLSLFLNVENLFTANSRYSGISTYIYIQDLQGRANIYIVNLIIVPANFSRQEKKNLTCAHYKLLS